MAWLPIAAWACFMAAESAGLVSAGPARRNAASLPDDLASLRQNVAALPIDPALEHAELAEKAKEIVLSLVDQNAGNARLGRLAPQMHAKMAQSFMGWCGPYVNYCTAEALLSMALDMRRSVADCLPPADAPRASAALRAAVDAALSSAREMTQGREAERLLRPDSAELVELMKGVDKYAADIEETTGLVPAALLELQGRRRFESELAGALRDEAASAATERSKHRLASAFYRTYAALCSEDPCIAEFTDASKAGALGEAWKEYYEYRQRDPEGWQRIVQYRADAVSTAPVPPEIRRRIDAQREADQAEERRLHAQRQREVFTLGAAGAAAAAVRLERGRLPGGETAPASADHGWIALELFITGLDGVAQTESFAAVVPAVARFDGDMFEMRLGAPRVEQGEAGFIYRMAGTDMQVACGPTPEVRSSGGMPPLLPRYELAVKTAAVLVCQVSERPNAPPTPLGLWQASMDHTVMRGWAVSLNLGATVTALALDGPEAAGAVADTLAQASLCRMLLALAEAPEGERDRVRALAQVALDVSAEVSNNATRLLRAELARSLAAESDDQEVRAASLREVLETIVSPPDSPIRHALSSLEQSVPSVLLNARTAPVAWAWAEERGGAETTEKELIEGRVAALLTGQGLPQERALSLVDRAHRRLRERKVPRSVIVNDWCASAYALGAQARAAAVQDRPDAQARAQDAIAWMLHGAGRYGARDRHAIQTAWGRHLGLLQRELERVLSAGPAEGREHALLEQERQEIERAIWARMGVAGFPPLDFQPTSDWLAKCMARAAAAAQQDTRRAYPELGVGEGWPASASAEVCRFALHALAAHVYEMLLREPDGPAPNGYAHIAMPRWADEFNFSYTPASGPVLSIRRKP